MADIADVASASTIIPIYNELSQYPIQAPIPPAKYPMALRVESPRVWNLPTFFLPDLDAVGIGESPIPQFDFTITYRSRAQSKVAVCAYPVRLLCVGILAIVAAIVSGA